MFHVKHPVARSANRAGAKRPAHAPEGRIRSSQVAAQERSDLRLARSASTRSQVGAVSQRGRAVVPAPYGDLLRDTAPASSGGREAAGTKLEPLALVQHVDLLEFSLGLREVQDALDDGDDPDHP